MMEFHEKLQALRKAQGLTQEELAEKLYVSRTAVSKWESGRGIPNLESLKAISRFFGVTLDDLLSTEDLQMASEKTTAPSQILWGLLDCSMVLLLFLPFFRGGLEGEILAQPLVALTGVQVYLKAAYGGVVLVSVAQGLLMLAFQNGTHPLWVQYKYRLSLIWNTVGALLLILGQQPYAAVFGVALLIFKGMILKKHP